MSLKKTNLKYIYVQQLSREEGVLKMNRQTLKRLMVKGTMAYVAVFSLVLMVAMPAVALIAARNSVNSRSIINGQVTYRDIGKKAVRNKHIGKKAVKRANIGRDAVNGYHIKSSSVMGSDIKNGTIKNADIAAGAAISASKINRAGFDAVYVNDGAGEVHADDIALNQVNSNHITNDSIKNADIKSNAAIADSKISYSTKTGYLSIPAAALTPSLNGMTYSSSSYLTGYGWFKAPVNLPQGAVVQALRYYAYDNSAGYTYAVLNRADWSPSTAENMAQTGNTVGTSTNWRPTEDLSIGAPIINNQSGYAYYVNVFLSSNSSALRAGNIRIKYTYSSPGS